jgi:hypothetical protein
MNSVPTSFDFGAQAIRPCYVVKTSYGNDSIALIRYLHERNQRKSLGKVVCLYNDTGWAAKWWEGRVQNGEELAKSYGFIPARTTALPWKKLLKNHAGWPDKMRRFCTQELKIIPTMFWLLKNDPEGKAEMVCGVRREESAARRLWPEYVESSPADEGRPQWSPLIFHTKEERDALIERAGWQPLAHRSRECRCIMANGPDIASWSEEDIIDIEALETWLTELYPNRIKFMFHPQRMKGKPQGIRQVVAWAKQLVSDRLAGKQRDDGGELEPSSGCDSGYCTG